MQFTTKALTAKRLGQILRAARKFHGFTLKQVATHAGIKVSRLHHWESGKAEPSMLHLQVLCAVLRLDPFFLYFPNKDRHLDSKTEFVCVTPDPDDAASIKVTTRKRMELRVDEDHRRDTFLEACGVPTERSLAVARAYLNAARK